MPQPDADTHRLLHTPAEAAALLAVRESWLRREAGRREIPCTFLGRHLRFSSDDLASIAGQAPGPHAPPDHRAAAPSPFGTESSSCAATLALLGHRSVHPPVTP
ncbi:helix-turn-helix domain-containing protein [Saccharothrix yanglingensis]|uniref:helix-turn-helix domain-containing protein n=1 Tax=Saccharothrix yanglingensis TaxID=659496 RepID=UPI003528AAAD